MILIAFSRAREGTAHRLDSPLTVLDFKYRVRLKKGMVID